MRLLTLAAAGLCAALVWLFRQEGKIKRFWGCVFALITAGCMAASVGASLYQIQDGDDSFYVGSWVGDRYYDTHWKSELNWREESGRLWRLSRWFGGGEAWSRYEEELLENLPEDVDWESEPYHSALEERQRFRSLLWESDSELLLNLLCYRLGRWTWCVYLLLALAWTGAGIALLTEVSPRRDLILAGIALCLLAVRLWLPALSCLGLVYSARGPLFTAPSGEPYLFVLCTVVPAFGLLLGLTLSAAENEKLSQAAERLKKVF